MPTAQDFERSFSSMANIKPTVTFIAEDVTQQNAALLKRVAKQPMCEPIQNTPALTILTTAGPAMGSLTTTRTTPTATTTSCAITANIALLRALRPMEHQNAGLPHTLWKVFAKVVDPLLQVDRNAAQQALSSNVGLGKSVPSAEEASAPSSSTASSATLPTSAAEGSEAVGGGTDWVEGLRQEVE